VPKLRWHRELARRAASRRYAFSRSQSCFRNRTDIYHRCPSVSKRVTQANHQRLRSAVTGYTSACVRSGVGCDSSHYDDIKSGRVKPIDGEAFFDGLRQREDELLKQRNPK